MVKFSVCDDDREMAEHISNKLHTFYPDECEIKTYTNGASLLSDCCINCFDAYFLDIGMPEMNGLEIAEKIRRKDPRAKIIFVSNKHQTDSI